jgi:hypothetical protein
MARTAVVPIRFSDEERKFLYEQASSVGLSLSSFIRRAALKRRMPPPPVPQINRDSYQELCRIGNNLNQVARAVHERRIQSSDGAFASLLTELGRAVKGVGMRVYGVEA